jgi:hypothetical protein
MALAPKFLKKNEAYTCQFLFMRATGKKETFKHTLLDRGKESEIIKAIMKKSELMVKIPQYIAMNPARSDPRPEPSDPYAENFPIWPLESYTYAVSAAGAIPAVKPARKRISASTHG